MSHSIKTAVILMLGAFTVLTFSHCKKAPEADFNYVIDGMTVSFSYTGSEEVDVYTWNFGDGVFSASENPSHTYATAGTYEVSLTVENSKGEDTHSETLVIEGPTASASVPELTFGDADGAFYAINSNTVQTISGTEVTIKVGSSVAWFSNGSDFVNVGEVNWKQGSKSGTLNYNADAGTYTWVESEQPTNGFNNNGISYTIEGGNGFPSIGGSGLSNLYPFPGARKIDQSTDGLNGEEDYTLQHDGSISNADSVYFSIYGPDGIITKRADGSNTSATFTAAEMQSLGKGMAILQIAAFNIYSDNSTGKKFYMVNEAVASRTVTLE